MRDPGGPAVVLALLLIETAIGGLAVLFATDLWGKVRWGFYKLAGTTITLCGGLGLLAIREPLLRAPVPASARVAFVSLAVFVALLLAWQGLLFAKRRWASRVASMLAVPAGLSGLIAIGLDPATATSGPVAIAQLLAGALFAGAVLDGLLLGHWHLVDRKLSTQPIGRLNTLWLIGCVAVVVGALPVLGAPSEVSQSVSPLLGAGNLVVWLAIGLAALCLVIGGFIRALVREGSIQSATGLFYLGVIMGFAAEFAAKVRFF